MSAKARLTFEEEGDFIFDKVYNCPVCEQDFINRTVRSSRIRTERIDYDPRPVHSIVDQVKYDVIACPQCGYAALSRYHGTQSDKQLALANAVARKAKPGEKAYLCLKSAWLIRGETGSLRGTEEGTEERIAKNETAEKDYLKQALEGFIQARQTENYPIAGMDEKTLDDMLAALYYSQDMLQECARFIGIILLSPYITPNLRAKTQILKELMNEKKKKLQK